MKVDGILGNYCPWQRRAANHWPNLKENAGLESAQTWFHDQKVAVQYQSSLSKITQLCESPGAVLLDLLYQVSKNPKVRRSRSGSIYLERIKSNPYITPVVSIFFSIIPI